LFTEKADFGIHAHNGYNNPSSTFALHSITTIGAKYSH